MRRPAIKFLPEYATPLLMAPFVISKLVFMKMLFVLLLITTFTACSVKLMTPAQPDVDRVSGKYPGYSLAELNTDKALYESTCSRCHRLKSPTSRSEAKWDKIVPKMIARLNKKEGKEVIDAKQQESILRYLVTMGPSVKQ
jgi:cytochrome c5